jgi:hypothetical protein
MSEGPAYVILGRGRWASRIRGILSWEDRRVSAIADIRKEPQENEASYKSRLTESLRASGAQIAWLCVPPGPHVRWMMEAALAADLHVVAEKPWQCSRAVTKALMKQAKASGRLAAIHYEYCLLDEVESWREEFYPGAGLRFGGRYCLRRADNSGIPALENLGSHLFSIRAYAIPQSRLSEIRCSYEKDDERFVWMERNKQRLSTIDLVNHGQPIIQAFVEKLEAACLRQAAFPFDLDLAFRIAAQLRAYAGRRSSR